MQASLCQVQQRTDSVGLGHIHIIQACRPEHVLADHVYRLWLLASGLGSTSNSYADHPSCKVHCILSHWQIHADANISIHWHMCGLDASRPHIHMLNAIPPSKSHAHPIHLQPVVHMGAGIAGIAGIHCKGMSALKHCR